MMNTIVLGEKSDKVFLFVHGNGENKEEAIAFADIAVPFGYQVMGIDLPVMSMPWEVMAKLIEVKEHLKQNYTSISIRANSIGAWFSLLAFQDEAIDKALFVSPLLDMKLFIEGMDKRDDAYYDWVLQHPLRQWNAPTYILRPKKDLVVRDEVYDSFIAHHECQVQVVEDGEHWFHTHEQMEVLKQWEKTVIQ